jgi:hypothetical protein
MVKARLAGQRLSVEVLAATTVPSLRYTLHSVGNLACIDDSENLTVQMKAERRALDKIFKRRDRYEIPDWQRGKVWDIARRRHLIDTILRGWKLPKFYLVKSARADGYEVVDGQQRLTAIWEFCSNELSLSDESAKEFGARFYNELSQSLQDAFDDFEIEYDVIEEASEEELKDFFQRVQKGLPLTSSEKLNGTHSKLADFCRKTAKHPFFSETVAIGNTRYAHFDIVAKATVVEIEGLDTGLRFEEVQPVFDANKNFSSTSAVAKRVMAALDLLNLAFKGNGHSLRTRTVVQSLVTLSCKIVSTGRASEKGVAAELKRFFETFQSELVKQVELGGAAADSDYVTFQHSVNANAKNGALVRHQILLRKLFYLSPTLADLFEPSIVAETGVAGRIGTLGESVAELVTKINTKYSLQSGHDLFKATNRTVSALSTIKKPIKTIDDYGNFVDALYFLFRESAGQRFEPPSKLQLPQSFVDVNDLRTHLRHDIDHGKEKKVKQKRRKLGGAFAKYAGSGAPETTDPSRLPLIQANLLGALQADLQSILSAV